MVVKIYVSRTSGNIMMKVQQEHIKRMLEAKNIEYEEIDIADPYHKKEKEFMKETMKLTDEALETLPPQIFKDGQWKGNHDTFLQAVEQEQVFKTLDVECPPDEVEFQRRQEQQQATNIIATHKPT